MKKTFKKFSRSALGQAFYGQALANYMRLVDLTSTYIYRPENLGDYSSEHTPAIYVGWHAHVLSAYQAFHKNQRPHILASPYPDGQFVARAMVNLGHKGIIEGAGNASKIQGKKAAQRAFMGMVKLLKSGQSVSLSADVPKGPAYKSGEGVILLARKTGAPIIPMSTSSQNAIRLNTWDKFQIHRPFSKISALLGEPLYVSDDKSPLINHQNKLDEMLNRLNEQAVLLCTS